MRLEAKPRASTALSFTVAYGENSGTSETVEVGSTAGVEAQVTYRRQLTGGASCTTISGRGPLFLECAPSPAV